MSAVREREEPSKQLLAEIDELRALLSEVRTLMSARSNLSAGRDAGEVIRAANAKLTALRAAIHGLQTEIASMEARLERSERETWHEKAKRADATARGNRAERLLQEIQESTVWKSLKPLWKLLRRTTTPRDPATPKSDLAFAIEAPTQWEVGTEIVLIRGWCLSRSGEDIVGVRGKIGKKGRIGRYGLEREDFDSAHGNIYGALRCGFAIEMPVPVGTSKLRLEAIVQGGEWQPFYEHEITRTQTAADAALQRAANQSATNVATTPPAKLPRCAGIKARRAADLLLPPLREHAAKAGAGTPLFSIITPTFDPKPQWLAEAAFSLIGQSCFDWEWCLVDDGSRDREIRQLIESLGAASSRVRVKFNENAGISAATNDALDLASGDFVCFLDHDDLLAPDALEEMQQTLVGGADVAYSDEDKLNDTTGSLVEPFYKPDWSPEYFRGAMYVGHLLCVRRDLAQRVCFNSEFDGVQDFEFMLRVSETGARIAHVPKVLYHWRKTPGSIAERADAKPEIDRLQQRAVNSHLERTRLPARAETKLPHRLRMIPLPREQHPRISIIIPSRDAPELLARCLGSLFGTTSYPDFEVILIDNETSDAAALAVMSQHPIRRVEFPGTFNFSRANNIGVREATGTFVLFLNNDTEVISADWLQQLLYYAEQEDVGAAGALLVYEDRTVQHAGVALGMRGTADHTMRGFPLHVDGYAGSLVCAREVSAVTGACMMMRKSLFIDIGGFNEHFFTAYQDLDLCLRLRARQLRVIYTPEAVVVHHESVSRKKYYDMVDRMLLLDQWEPVIEGGDPYYNPNLNLERGDYSPARAA